MSGHGGETRRPRARASWGQSTFRPEPSFSRLAPISPGSREAVDERQLAAREASSPSAPSRRDPSPPPRPRARSHQVERRTKSDARGRRPPPPTAPDSPAHSHGREQRESRRAVDQSFHFRSRNLYERTPKRATCRNSPSARRRTPFPNLVPEEVRFRVRLKRGARHGGGAASSCAGAVLVAELG